MTLSIFLNNHKKVLLTRSEGSIIGIEGLGCIENFSVLGIFENALLLEVVTLGIYKSDLELIIGIITKGSIRKFCSRGSSALRILERQITLLVLSVSIL